MSSNVKLVGPTLGRVLMMTLISASLLFSVSAFIPHDASQDTIETLNPAEEAFLKDFNSNMSHNLVVDMAELRCLALNIYFEARSEKLDGQLAVAGVTMNRVASEKFPDTICGVVTENRVKTRLHRCQFSWWCDGKKDSPKEAVAWANAQQVARLYIAGIYQDPTEDALWYHADYVNPDWAARLMKTAKIGRHIFYRKPAPRQVALF